MSADSIWTLRIFRTAIAVAAAALVVVVGFSARFEGVARRVDAASPTGVIDELKREATDRMLARLGRVGDGGNALRGLRAANDESVKAAATTVERSATELERAVKQRVAAAIPSAAPGARFLSPVETLSAAVTRREDALDVGVIWERSGAEDLSLRFEVWRWTSAAEPRRVAADLAEARFVDAGLPPGPIELGYAVYAVTADGSGSRSEGRTVQVELPAVHEIRLVEPDIEERSEPPPAANGASEPPASAPESVRLEVLRLDDGRSEVVEVRPGIEIGQALKTSMALVALSWVELERPIRYREPVFRSDGTLEPGEGGPQWKTFVLAARVWLTAAELRDGWGRSLQIVPPSEAPRTR